LKRLCADVHSVEIQKIEQKEHETGGNARIRRQLDHAEGGDAVAAQFAVEISLASGDR